MLFLVLANIISTMRTTFVICLSRRVGFVVFLILPVLTYAASSGEIGNQNDSKSEASIYLGPLDLTPVFSVDEGYNDNIFSSDLYKKGSWFTMIKPAAQLGYKGKRSSINATYGIQQSLYADSPADDYLDQIVKGGLSHEFTSRNKLEISLANIWAHDMRGTAFGQGNLATQVTEPDQFHSSSYLAKYQYGSDKARGQLQLNIGVIDKQYSNHPERTVLGDLTNYRSGLTFFYRWRSKTSFYLEGDYVRSDYKNSPLGVVYDNDAYSYYLGVTWKGTAKTTGNVKFGYLRKSFVDDRFDPFNALTWQVGVTWRPFRYSQFELGATRDAMPTLAIGGSFIDQKRYSLDWKHAWSDRVKTTVGVAITNYNWVGLLPERKDDLAVVNFGLDYKIKRWLNVGASYTYGNRSSSQEIYTYGANIFMVTLGATL